MSKKRISATLDWEGDDLKAKMESASKQGLIKTGASATAQAMSNAPVDTGHLRADIAMRDPHQEGSSWVLLWGNFIVNYALYVEAGTYRMPGRYYLRRAADAEYPNLAANIKASL